MRKFIFTLLLSTLSFLTQAQVVAFTEDFENPPGNVTSSGSPGWFTNTRLQVSGTNSDTAAIVNVGDISYLETASFSCNFQFFVTLTFKSICKAEFFDAGTIEYSLDGGFSWDQLIDTDGNPGGLNNCNYLGTGLFRTQNSKFQEASYGNWAPGSATVPDNSWWQTETFDISLVAGGNPDVKLRFKLSDENFNGGNSRTGWAVDDIEVITSFCELIPPVVYQTTPFYSQTVYNLGPYTVNATATDQAGINAVNLYYTINGVAQTPIVMTNTVDSFYTAQLPAVAEFDTVCYYIEAIDASFCANLAYYPGPTSATEICFVAEAGISFPFCDGYDSGQNLWTATTLTPGTQWELGVPNYGLTNSAFSAPNAWDINLNSAYTNNATAYLVSPQFSFLVGAGATLEFRQNRNAEQGWDGVRLEWTIDSTNGPWNVLGTLQGPTCIDCENWYNDDQLNSSLLPAWTGNSAGWIKSSIILDAQFNNQPQVWFRFVFTSDPSVITDGFSIDNFCISLAEPDDVGAKAIIQPGPTGPAGNCIDVIVQLKNHGTNTQNTFDVYYQIDNDPPVMDTWTGTLTPGATFDFTMTPCFTVPTGAYSVCAWTDLPGDANPFNDTTCTNSLGIPVLSLTACDDFESGNTGFQTATTNAVSGQWQLGTPAWGATTGANSGTNAWDINLTSATGTNVTANLITPIYDLVGSSNAYLSFFRNQNTAQNDGLRVLYNVNGSGIWNLLGTVNDPDGQNWYNNPTINGGQPGWGGTSGGWVESRYYLQNMITATGATFIQFRFDFVAGFNGLPTDGVSIDDLCVKQPGPDDVGVVFIIEPSASSPAGNTSNVSVRLRNFGTAAQTDIPVFYQVNNDPPVSASFNGNLASNATTVFSMPPFTVPSGSYDFCAWTELPLDSDNSNDTSCTVSVGVPVILVNYTSPYSDNFDGPNVGWTTANPGNPASNWELGSPGFGTTNTAHTPPTCWDVNLFSGYTANAACELYTPIFDLTNAVDPEISFWRNSNCETGWDGTRMEYTIVGSGVWTLVGAANLTAPCWVNWYNSTPTIISSGQPAWMGQTGGWVKVEANCLPFLSNSGLVQFRFIFTSDASVNQDGFSIDDFEVRIPVPLTASPITVNTSAINNNFIFPGQVLQLTSPISNPGTTPLTSVNANLWIDGNLIVTDPIAYNPALPSGQNQLHTFSTTWIATPGLHEICVITSEPNNGLDQNPFDDTTCVFISVFDSVTITSTNPYCTDFESGPQWVSVNANTYNQQTNSWQVGLPSQTIINDAHSGVNAWMTNLTANYPSRDTSGLFTPVFSVDSTKCYKLSFWHKYDTEQWADGGTVEYSVDNAASWQHLGFASSQPQPWFNSAFITALGGSPGLPGWSGTQATWTLAEHDVTFFNSGPVIFRMRFASDNSTHGEGWAIDDFCFEEIAGPCVVGLNDPGYNGFELGQNHPNPVNGITTIEYMLPSAGAVKVSINNVIGQEIAVPVNGNKIAGKHSFEVNTKTLNEGVYYYTMEFEGKSITKKMVVIK